MGVWYGIQLKERRGRHDGTVNGIQYFACAAQYGLHCRQSHLTLMDDEQSTDNNEIFDDNELKQYKMQAKARPSFEKPQTSAKWASYVQLHLNMTFNISLHFVYLKEVLGFRAAAPTRGLQGLPAKSQLQLNVMMPLNIQKTESTSMTEPQTLRLISVSQQKKKLQKHTSLSVIMPRDVFRHNLSVNVLPGMNKKSSKTNANAAVSHDRDASFKRGTTTVVLPGYYNGLKQRKFTDCFDMDEIDDFLGEGEFGVVYKCRKVEYAEDDYDDFSTTMVTSTRLTKPTSITETRSDLYPGDRSDSDDSYGSNTRDAIVYAVKKIKKAKFHHLGYKDKQTAIESLQGEIKLLEKIKRHKHIGLEGAEYVIDLVDVFEDRNYLYIVTNYCAGGNLWKYIEDSDEESHHEAAIQKIMKQMLCGLVFLHRNNMAHLDIKPDNIMFTSDNRIQLIDFGVSSVIPPLHKAGVLKGTPNFVAPEVIEGFYDKKADVWSIGVIFFMLRFGYPPFYIGDADAHETAADSQHNELFDLIKKGFNPIVKKGLGAWFPEEVSVSQSLKDLISSMLDKDLAKRLTAAECLAHPYFKDVADANTLPVTVMDALTKFSGQCQFKVMISRLFASDIEAQQMKQLKQVWNKFDVDEDGSLTLRQFRDVMNAYDHGYKDYQIEAMFDSLDWNETETINFNSLLTAFSYQRLVAVDERLWEAFARLDQDNDGLITKAEIKRVLATVHPDGFDEGIKQLDLFTPDTDTAVITPDPDSPGPELRRNKNISIWIGNCMIDADWDDNGQIDYEEFLRALHPRFNEPLVTPKGYTAETMANTVSNNEAKPKHFFEPSVGSGLQFIASNKLFANENEEEQINRKDFDND
eukprot:211187_1